MKGNVFYMPEKILLQGIFLTQGSNPGLLHCRKTPYCLSHPGKSYILEKIQNIDIKRIQKRETFFSEMTWGTAWRRHHSKCVLRSGNLGEMEPRVGPAL